MKVTPSVVIADGAVWVAGKLIVFVPMTTPFGPIMIAVPLIVIVELVGPNVNVDSSIITSVIGKVGNRVEFDGEAEEL